jgi:hypothetical protein
MLQRLKRYCPIIALKSHALPLASSRLINIFLASQLKITHMRLKGGRCVLAIEIGH